MVGPVHRVEHVVILLRTNLRQTRPNVPGCTRREGGDPRTRISQRELNAHRWDLLDDRSRCRVQHFVASRHRHIYRAPNLYAVRSSDDKRYRLHRREIDAQADDKDLVLRPGSARYRLARRKPIKADAHPIARETIEQIIRNNPCDTTLACKRTEPVSGRGQLLEPLGTIGANEHMILDAGGVLLGDLASPVSREGVQVDRRDASRHDATLSDTKYWRSCSSARCRITRTWPSASPSACPTSVVVFSA